jgi:hypothetical protein
MKRHILLMCWIVIVIVLSAYVHGQESTDVSTVAGKVLDMHGRPVQGAHITFFAMDNVVTGPKPVTPVTDLEGYFKLVLPPLGRTRLGATKETEGYPDTQGLLFASGTEKMPEVNLAPGSHHEVVIQLGPPDGTIEGTVVAADTQMPLNKGRITLRRNSPASMFSTTLPKDGHFLFALPSAPIEITIEAPGYRPWTYSDAKSGALILPPSEHRTIRVELVPAS